MKCALICPDHSAGGLFVLHGCTRVFHIISGCHFRRSFMYPVSYLHVSRYFGLDVCVSGSSPRCLNKHLNWVLKICSCGQDKFVLLWWDKLHPSPYICWNLIVRCVCHAYIVCITYHSTTFITSMFPIALEERTICLPLKTGRSRMFKRTASKTKKIGSLASCWSTTFSQNITQNKQQRSKHIWFDQTNTTVVL